LDEKSPTGLAFFELTENVMRQVEARNREIEPTKKVEINN